MNYYFMKTRDFFYCNFKSKIQCEESNIPFDEKLNPSDLRFYLNQREQVEFHIDHAKLQEYFPLNVVIDGTFKIYQVRLLVFFIL